MNKLNAPKTPLCKAPGMTHVRAPLDMTCIHCGASLKPFEAGTDLAAIEAVAKAAIAEQEAILTRVAYARQVRLGELRACRTPEDFVAKGFALDCDRSEYREGTEYMYRLKNGLPTKAPRLAVGQLVYDDLHRCNTRVVSVTWDGGIRGWGGASGWRVSVPGYGGDDHSFGAPREDAPTIEHVEVSWSCWAPIHTCQQQVTV